MAGTNLIKTITTLYAKLLGEHAQKLGQEAKHRAEQSLRSAK